jgi:hypothetical protein
MKLNTTLAAFILSTLSINALAEDNPGYPSATLPAVATHATSQATAQGNAPAGKTRAEVYQELIEARRQGLIPTPEYDYPPSQRTIENNKARNQIVERYWASQKDASSNR